MQYVLIAFVGGKDGPFVTFTLNPSEIPDPVIRKQSSEGIDGTTTTSRGFESPKTGTGWLTCIFKK